MSDKLNSSRALEGLTILDLTRLLPGAVATQYFVRRGARVIKIEQPGAGDYGRTLSPAVFERTNAGKQSVALDLKHPRGKQALLTLAARADVLIEGFRPGVMERLGVGYADLKAVNAGLIYVSLTGYGQHGPLAGLAGHDINYIAMGGLLGLQVPAIPGVQIADLVGGSQQCVTEILLALLERQASGLGRLVDVSMTAGVETLLEFPLAQPGNGMLTGRYACYNLYPARDGRWLAVGALEAKFWTVLCRCLECPDLIPLQFDEARQPEVKARIAAIFATRDAADWFSFLRESDCCVTPVLTLAEVAARAPEPSGAPSVPALGEHTAGILLQAGYSEQDIAELKRTGAIA